MSLEQYLAPDTRKRASGRFPPRMNRCAGCQRCIADCPWLHQDRPVPGWTAEAVRLTVRYYSGKRRQVIPTYRIAACPLYVPPPPWRLGGEETKEETT